MPDGTMGMWVLSVVSALVVAIGNIVYTGIKVGAWKAEVETELKNLDGGMNIMRGDVAVLREEVLEVFKMAAAGELGKK